MQSVSGHGAMAAVMAKEERVREALRGLETRVSIAGLNAPESVVISGYEQELGIAEERLKQPACACSVWPSRTPFIRRKWRRWKPSSRPSRQGSNTPRRA